MVPEDFLEIEKVQNEVIKKAKDIIYWAREKAKKSEMPANIRPATAHDIVDGAIIWYDREKEYGGPFWNIVCEVLKPRDAFKAYCADDGCRYGLDGAFVSI